jgi:hypothetical protein
MVGKEKAPHTQTKFPDLLTEPFLQSGRTRVKANMARFSPECVGLGDRGWEFMTFQMRVKG